MDKYKIWIKTKFLSEKFEKPILFTEFGYRSMDYTGKKPWLVDRNQMEVNLEAQAEATQAVFDEFWEKLWAQFPPTKPFQTD